MTIEEQLTAIISRSKQNELIPFLQSLAPADKKTLAAPLKQLEKEYNEWGDTGGGRWGHSKGNDKQRDMLQLAAFVCYNRVDYQKSQRHLWFVTREKIGPILTWYTPEWFSDYLNKQLTDENFWSLDYDWMMELYDRDAFQPAAEIIARALPGALFRNHREKGWAYEPGRLLEHPLTLQQHIWYLFDYESSLPFRDRSFLAKQGEQNQHWVNAFIQYSSEGKIDRPRLLKEALLAGNKNFNKVLSAWFVELFEKLEPSVPELILLQQELVMVLNAPHSKPASVSLHYLKKIIHEKEVDAAAILDALPVTLSGNTKSLVSSTTMLLEQIAKKEKALRWPVAQLCCQVFIHADEGLQTRAAKIIAKYGDEKDESLRAQLASYHDAILHAPRKILASLLEEPAHAEVVVASGVAIGSSPVTPSRQALPHANTIDDLLFLAAQAFDNNEPWHFDALPDAMVRLQHQLKGPVLSQLQPALQRALKLGNGDWRSTVGTFDYLLAVFFIDVCIYLVRKFPGDAADLQKVFAGHDQKRFNEVKRWLDIPGGELYLNRFGKEYKGIYSIGRQRLQEAVEKIRRSDHLPLLSTPTHAPAWIDPLVLVERLAQYQQQNVLAEATDAQVAIARCQLTDTKKAVEAAGQKLEGEMQRLLLFLLQADAEPPPPFSQPEYWMMAALSKYPKKSYPALDHLGYPGDYPARYAGQLSWVAETEEYDARPYDYKLGRYVSKMETRKHLRIDFSSLKTGQEEPKKKGWFSWLKKKAVAVVAPPPSLLYDRFSIPAAYLSNENNDIQRAMLMAPNNPEVLLPWILHSSLRYPAQMGETDKRMAVAALQLLHEQWSHPGEMAHLFIATSMLAPDKTTAGTAAEIWLRYAPEGEVDNVLLGRILGTHEKIEFAPLKRFTDLVMQSLFRISPQHNRLLQVVIENMIAELPDTPVRGLKKLLELLVELVAMNKQPVEDNRVKEKLKAWKETEGLKKVVDGLLSIQTG